MSFIGQKLPAFSLTAYQNGDFHTVTDQDMRGKWAVICFYPADFSFVCPTELGDLQDHYDQFKSVGAEVYSVSEDTEFVHMAWAEASPTIKKVAYPMVADPAGTLASALDVRDAASGQAFRGTFIVDPDGVIQTYSVNNFGIGRNANEIIRTLQAAQFVAAHGDQVCPANWRPGEKTLKPGAALVGKI
ncbi:MULTISPECIES: redoxin domain-containing protein [Lacticaseibacillus]|uniref:Alkyl hydroperoxide reductase C n=1 Tax=Lacticaseibacillus casei DSM 20011 = JCM 1134 = ATCC 393 TaxID=1423732 RepID=A0AAD1AQY8_LACCA|nr:redoxin domain-containing protein [Lacticaseibacillus casei]HAJ53341.1 peroxiredoxin [Lactobacillus sp.]MBI6598825.1 redoxin domain-containing protein [Lacticaseibacillus casei]MBO1482501.1 redoxin domain-containing protein [Lacticaseibacillus casei]MBO2417772.1 redoxin domain-containing protein [Lacticaseibacillus casei]MCK2082137.1 redoxin domain-containing protein [Lacticaseibacillus casei]